MIIAALLPCYWVYLEVAKWMSAQQYANSDNPYQEWIDIYAGEEFSKVVEEALSLANELAREVDEKTRMKMESVFEKAFQLEWMFWDSAYKMDEWPI